MSRNTINEIILPEGSITYVLRSFERYHYEATCATVRAATRFDQYILNAVPYHPVCNQHVHLSIHVSYLVYPADPGRDCTSVVAPQPSQTPPIPSAVPSPSLTGGGCLRLRAVQRGGMVLGESLPGSHAWLEPRREGGAGEDARGKTGRGGVSGGGVICVAQEVSCMGSHHGKNIGRAG